MLTNRVVWFLGLVLLPALACADIYRSMDQEGNVIFSDQPMKGAKKVTLPPLQSYNTAMASASSAPSGATSAPSAKSSTATLASKAASRAGQDNHVYDDLAIATPADQATIQNSGGKLDVNVALAPALRSGDKLIITIDDEPVAESTEQNVSFLLEAVPRGSHQLQAYVMGPDTHILKSSKVISFYMQQTSVNSPANPNNPNNKPTSKKV